MSMTKNSEHIPYENADWNTDTGGIKTAAALVFIGAMASGCREDDLRTLPEQSNPWTESCYGANNGFLPPEVEDDPDTDEDESLEGRVVNPWGSEAMRLFAFAVTQEGDIWTEDVTDIERAQECLRAQAALLTFEGRCSDDPDMPATVATTVTNPHFGLTATAGPARDASGEVEGYDSGENCTTDAELSMVITANFGDPDELTLSLKPGAGEIGPDGNLLSNRDDGSILFPDQYVRTPYEIEHNLHSPFFGIETGLVNPNGERLDTVLDLCVVPTGATAGVIDDDYTDSNGCVVPPQ